MGDVFASGDVFVEEERRRRAPPGGHFRRRRSRDDARGVVSSTTVRASGPASSAVSPRASTRTRTRVPRDDPKAGVSATSIADDAATNPTRDAIVDASNPTARRDVKIRAKDARHTTRGGVHRERRYRRYDRRDVPRRDDIDAANRFGAGDGDGDESRGAAGRDARRDAARRLSREMSRA